MLNNLIEEKPNQITTPFSGTNIPDISPYLYGPKKITEIIDRYLYNNSWCKTNDFETFKCLLLDYKPLLNYEEQKKISYNLVQDILDLLKDRFPYCNIEIFSRIKSFLKLCSKVYLFSGQKNLDIHSIKDSNGLRIVLYSNTTKICYDVMNVLLSYLINNNGFGLLEAEPLIGTENFDISNFPDLLLPNEAEEHILPQYLYGVKDYIKEPKGNTGYQSLHAVLIKPIDHSKLEIQVRNTNMHNRALSDHKLYKEKRYAEKLDFASFINYGKINLDGFFFDKNRITQDSQGLIKAKILLNTYRFN